MSTYTQILYHIVFSTKGRYRTLELSKREEILKYAWAVLKNNKSYVYQMNMMDDHFHILCSIHPQKNLSDMVKLIKASVGNWIRDNNVCPRFAGWQNGYGAFTVGWSNREHLIKYIKDQQQHHKRFTYEVEYQKLLDDAGVEYNKEYL